MDPARTAWHLGFAALVAERAPPGIEVRTEVPIAIDPLRADLLLLRRSGEARRDEEAKVLRGLWPRLGSDSIVEYKSPSRPPRRGDLLRLVGCGAIYHASQVQAGRLEEPVELTLVLVVASLTPTVRKEVERMGWKLAPLGNGYARIEGAMYSTILVVTDEVAPAERDDFLAIFSHREVVAREAVGWFERWLYSEGGVMQKIQDLEGYDEMLQKLLAETPVEMRLAGLTPEQRLAGLAPEQLLTALPVEALRALSEDFVRTLPSDVQAVVRERLRRG